MALSLGDCDQHFAAIRAATNASDLRRHLRALFDEYPVLSFELGRGSVFWRGRTLASAPFNTADEMSYPPAELTPVGRLNERGSQMLYAATREETVLHELGAKPGALVQFIGFRILLKESLRLAAIGELFHVFKTGYLRTLGRDPENAISKLLNSRGVELGKVLIYIDAFLASLLADPAARTTDYLPTRVLIELALTDSNADGLFYPSVQDGLGMNLAILPARYDASTHVVRSHVVRVNHTREFGMVDYDVLQEAATMSDEGRFTWQAPEAPHITRFFGLTEREHAFLAKSPQP